MVMEEIDHLNSRALCHRQNQLSTSRSDFFSFFFFLPHLKLRIYLGTAQRATKAISLN